MSETVFMKKRIDNAKGNTRKITLHHNPTIFNYLLGELEREVIKKGYHASEG